MEPLYAHSRNRAGRRHPLVDHLRRTAELAAEFAAPFGGTELARAAGLLHDLGKASPAFQSYLREAERGTGPAHGPDHKAAGAVLAARLRLEPLALLIQGHHGGLHDRSDAASWLRDQLGSEEVRRTLEDLPAELRRLLRFDPPRLPDLDRGQSELFLRMLFSALVDADFLDTEAHFAPETAAERARPMPDPARLLERLEDHLRDLEGKVSPTPVNRARAEIHAACLAAARLPPGLFRLAVPTGGGKTLAGMAFALRHALEHGMRRVIVAVPFTSVTEQTADVHMGVWGPEPVLEHHSALDLEALPDPRRRLWMRLAAENWEAPIVVTTTVQLFESLFGRTTSRTRKLHNVARSVILVDEAQALPVGLMRPIVEMLRLLCAGYGCSVVLSTATQPVADVPQLSWLGEGRDLVPEPRRFFERLRRVEWVTARERWSAERVAAEAARSPQALVVLNTRRAAVRQLDRCGVEALHLSTLLCGAHRRRVLAEVRHRLKQGAPCLLVTTQVIEAGVDVDFPLVLRAVAPFDSVVQAGGRCNREGRLERGRTVVFVPEEDRLPPGAYRTGAHLTEGMLRQPGLDFDDPGAAAEYFRQLYRTLETDQPRVLEAQRDLAYERVAERFRMIPDAGEPVVVPYEPEAGRLHDRLARASNPGEARDTLRRLQPYLVELWPEELAQARRRGWVEEGPLPLWTGPYDQVRGVGVLFSEESPSGGG
jgi:CRISPR-associated endonuclease/helicase Cas3